MRRARRLDTLAVTGELPTVIDAAKAILVDPADGQQGAPVRAAGFDDVSHSVGAAVQRVILAHDPQWTDISDAELRRHSDGLPELPEKATGQGPRTGMGKILPRCLT
jgi:hypothetical protein